MLGLEKINENQKESPHFFVRSEEGSGERKIPDMKIKLKT